jgi:putative ABC transport system ATP-binding protein
MRKLDRNAGPIVVAEHLSKTFFAGTTPVHALDTVNLTVLPGEVVLLMGPSGSGKTTLLSIVGCILRPSSGTVRIAGREVSGLSEKELATVRLEHIGFVFQNYNLFPTLTACQNVQVAMDLKKVPSEEARDRAAKYLQAVGIGEKLDVYPESLSGGQRQRLAIARALAGEPSIILADEPTAALDSKNGRTIMQILQTLAHTWSRAVVIVTHDNRIMEFADRIVHIEDGKIYKKSSDQ